MQYCTVAGPRALEEKGIILYSIIYSAVFAAVWSVLYNIQYIILYCMGLKVEIEFYLS